MKTHTTNRSFAILTILLLTLTFQIKLFSQEFESGQLYLRVIDSLGIPTISFGEDTIINMENESMENIFKKHDVYYFERAFPIVDSFPQSNKYLLDQVYLLECNCNEDSLLSDILEMNTYYSYVEKIPSIFELYTPNDYKIIDSLNNIPNYALDLINAEGAWDYTHGDSSIFIGLSDDGYLTTHKDLKNKIHEIIDPPIPISTHGTFVAGCAAAETDNNIGISSIGFDCKLILARRSYGQILELSNAGAKVVNCSWAGCTESETDKRIIHLCYDKGTLVVAGAGISPGAPSCPPDGNGYL